MVYNLWVKNVLDGVITVCVSALSFLCYHFLRRYTPNNGFFCEDTSIRYPYIEESISDWEVFLTTLCGPLVFFVVSDFLLLILKRRRWEKKWFLTVYGHCCVLLYGYSVCILACVIAKLTTGRLAPYFLDFCVPDVNCSSEENRFKYIDEYNCTGSEVTPKTLLEARSSFPSVYAALISVSMIYLCFYIEFALNWERVILVKLFLQFNCIIATFYVCFLRVKYYSHHMIDVAGGILIGSLIALYMVFCLTEKRTHKNKQV